MTTRKQDEIDVIGVRALAIARATAVGAMREVALSQAELARLMERQPAFISRILGGGHNMTIKTLAHALAACGFELVISARKRQ